MRDFLKKFAKYSLILIFGLWLALSVHSYVVTNAASRNYIPLLLLTAYIIIAGAFKIFRRLIRP